MTTGTARRVLVWSLGLGLGVAAAGGPVRLDPGEEAGAATSAARAPYAMEVVIEAGARAPWRPLSGQYQLWVQLGEVTLELPDGPATVSTGETRVVPAGVEFTLFNGGSGPARVVVGMTASLPDLMK
ncbi:cupin domain-containing protein [Deinococcus sp. KSM4-11]|uniref:cupin domain-containing protein n=1 Tax=Deinococcus sp. KSM4-11 TaxID=2568654 RepID=UPI0010A4C647|nr:cupin domain-containing protein [Deinococcus sp. KSM4-11]THF84004.1 cupin domain-containing protein [Deinococcus sp. KSM4-11]